MRGRWLVVAGEPSGDRTLAAVVEAAGARAVGIGGDALEARGVELLAHVRDLSGMGLLELGSRAPAIAGALVRLVGRLRPAPPTRAVLCSWSSGNARLGAWLRTRRIPVTWISPPEVWAFRPGRLPRLVESADRFVPTLPFEEALWRGAGADATWVGHPAADVVADRASLRRALGLVGPALAVLPGSRPAEVERLLPPFVAAARIVGIDARILVAPSLPAATRAQIFSTGLPTLEVDPARGAGAVLPAFDAALVASGTASLEAALAGVPPVVAYRLHPLTFAIARRWVRIQNIALPNVLLERQGLPPAFPERMQDRVTPERLASDLLGMLEHPPRRALAAVRAALVGPGVGRFAERAAALVDATVPRG